LIALANAIVDPWTMMIHTTYATLTNAAMMSSWWSICLTASADSPFTAMTIAGIMFSAIVGSVKVGEVQTVSGEWHNAWIGENCLQVGHAKQEDNRVEEYHMKRCPNAVRN